MAGIHLTLPHFYIVAGYRLSERVLQLVESPLMGSAKKRLAFRRLLYRSEDFSYQYFSREHKLFFFELWIEFISTAPRRKTLSASLYRCPEGLPVISRPNSSYALLSQRYEMATAYGSPCQSCGPSRSLWDLMPVTTPPSSLWTQMHHRRYMHLVLRIPSDIIFGIKPSPDSHEY